MSSSGASASGTKATKHVCDICGFVGKTKRELLVHGAAENHSPMQICTLCAFHTVWPHALALHMRSTHGENKCAHCDEKFESSESLRWHRQSVHTDKKYQCRSCPESFDLHMHRWKHELEHTATGVRPFSCLECGDTFNLRQNLRLHIAAVHSEVKTAVCPTCSKKFVRKCDLLRHMRSVHDKLRPHKCALCWREFQIHSRMLAHMRRDHKGFIPEGRRSAPLKCEHCKKNYLNEDTLARHVKNFHTEPKEYKCTMCTYTCLYRPSLKKHMSFQHANDLDAHYVPEPLPSLSIEEILTDVALFAPETD